MNLDVAPFTAHLAKKLSDAIKDEILESVAMSTMSEEQIAQLRELSRLTGILDRVVSDVDWIPTKE